MEMTRILLADDQAVIRASLRRFLEMIGRYYIIADAENGITAVSMAEIYRPDIVIMDLSMPRLDGIEATRQIVENGIPTRVIILSMRASHADVTKAMQVGARGYVHKSSVNSDVIAAIDAVLAGNYYVSPRLGVNYENFLSPMEPVARLPQAQLSL